MAITEEYLKKEIEKAGRNSFGQTPMKTIDRLAVETVEAQALGNLKMSTEDSVNLILLEAVMRSQPDFASQMRSLKAYYPLINSWYSADLIIRFLKKPKNPDSFFRISEELRQDSRPFLRRLGYTVFLKSDLQDNANLKKIAGLFREDEADTVNMAQGWLLSEIYIKSPIFAYAFFADGSLPKKVLKIGIAKSLDSFRIDEEEKIKLRELRSRIKGGL
jgi:3-methyladenine DNA glycosylase AlkD